MPSFHPPSPPPAGDRRAGSVGIVATVALLALATLLPEVVAPLVVPTVTAPAVSGGSAPAPGATAAAVAPEGEAEASTGGDVALDDEPEAGRQG